MDPRIRQRLANQIARGEVILFTGAGFSRAAIADGGAPLPGVSELTQRLWSLAFPSDAYDGSGLDDVYAAAIHQRRAKTIELMRSCLTVDAKSLPDEYALWFSFPWYRVYTLNVDNLEDAVARRVDLARPLVSLSALRNPMPAEDKGLSVVHLNGDLDDLPNVTFSQRQYGERLATWDLWYSNLARELKVRPVLYVGTSLNEPPLWQYIEQRGPRGSGPELRPGSYLVAHELPLARRVALSEYNVTWVQGTQESFCADVLSQLSDEAQRGQRALSSRLSDVTGQGAPVLAPIEDLTGDQADDAREFLRGREPRWSDFRAGGFAIVRDIDERLPEDLEENSARIILITGTAGTGKSSVAMRLVLGFAAAGQRVHVLNTATDPRVHRVRKVVAVAEIDVLLIDDVDRFGSATWGLLEDLISEKPDLRVIACARSTRATLLGLPEDAQMAGDRAHQVTVPTLGDSDIDLLLDALERANRLGVLRELAPAERHQRLERGCGRQLLVAMIEATSGLRFDAKIDSECSQLSGESGLVYAICAIANFLRAGLTLQELLSAGGGDGMAVFRSLEELRRQHLIVEKHGLLYLRHRVVAERAFRYYQESRLLAEPIRGLVFALSTGAIAGQLRSTRSGRLLVRLLNHDFLLRTLRTGDNQIDRSAVRHVYDESEPLLNGDYHYWLQYGSFETEEGDLDLAQNFLDQARGMAPTDPFVQTQWAYMTLKRASRHATDPLASEQSQTAFEELRDVIESRGRNDYYPFHVYGSQGLAWVKRAPLSRDHKVQQLLDIRRVLDGGLRLHPGNRELTILRSDVDREYLGMAVAAERPPEPS